MYSSNSDVYDNMQGYAKDRESDKLPLYSFARLMLTDFQNSITISLGSKFVIDTTEDPTTP